MPENAAIAAEAAARAAQNAGNGAGSDGWSMPEKWQGKSAEEIARAYGDLEREHGRMSDQYGKMSETVNQWREVWNQWDPVLSKFEYAPAAAVQLMEEAQRLRAEGDRVGARQAEREAGNVMRQWSEVVDPREQAQWLDQRFGAMQQQLGGMLQNAMTEFSQAIGKYVNNYGNLATRAMSMKIADPSLDINKLIEEAANISSGKYDPLDWAARIMQQPKALEKMIADKIAEERVKWDEERNAQMTTFAGAGGGRVPYRTPAYSSGGANATRVQPTMAQARQSFVQRFPTIRPPE